MKKTIISALALVLVAMPMVGEALADDAAFPYRKDFADVQPVDSYALKQGLDDGSFIVVDARSSLEYDVIHVDGAVHVAVSKKTFEPQIQDLAAQNPGKKIAFYCNGITCLKSYKAARKAAAAGVADVYAYDAGIPEWANMYPQQTQLLGKPITDPETQLLTKTQFKDRTLAWSYFKAAAGEEGAMVIDLRDKIQATQDLPDLQAVRGIPLEVFIPNFVAKKANQDKTLLIFDQVGKQVKWLQYYLEEYGYENYLFLEGGATSVLKSQEYRS